MLSFSLGWSLELGICKPYSCEVLVYEKKQWKLRRKYELGRRTAWLKRERSLNR